MGDGKANMGNRHGDEFQIFHKAGKITRKIMQQDQLVLQRSMVLRNLPAPVPRLYLWSLLLGSRGRPRT